MNGITVQMAIIDFIPVLLFFFATIILQRDLYNKMVKGAFALLASGSLLVLISGVFKALWKILYALNICDYTILDTSFFPMQGPGFLLVFLALIGMFTSYNNNHISAMAVVPVYNSNMPFVILQVIGCAGAQGCLCVFAHKLKAKFAFVLYIISFVFMLGMGYLSATFDDTSSMHWIAQLTNIISQGAFLWGTILLHKAGLGDKDIFKQKITR